MRWQSSATILEYPLFSIAVGPDPSKNETRGHARGIIAIGDMATGVIAVGGLACGFLALGGLALGAIALGGGALGLLALGGLAVGYFAAGGLAIGYAAMGGMAIGYYAMGGGVMGKFVVGPCAVIHKQSPTFPGSGPRFLSCPGRQCRDKRLATKLRWLAGTCSHTGRTSREFHVMCWWLISASFSAPCYT
ncbi:MAG TPA: hypothetical protein VET69_07795 [Terriglobales bacterium]|nr:hypothetical protein [Terriglobales bacterium]